MRVQKNVLPLQRRTYQVRRCKKVSAAKNTLHSLTAKRTFSKRKDTLVRLQRGWLTNYGF